MSAVNLLRINRIELLKFYDTLPKEGQGHASAINAVAGEDLGAGLLKHYLENVTGAQVTILADPCTPGTRSGSRLDRWILVKQTDGDTLFQVEIKNWSARAIGGKKLALDAAPDQITEYKMKAWSREWDEQLREPRAKSACKVLSRMKPPSKCVVDPSLIKPLLCMWAAMHPTGGPEPFFSVELPEEHHFHHQRLWIFSMSAYLRTLTDDYLEIEMPQTIQRRNWLKQFFD